MIHVDAHGVVPFIALYVGPDQLMPLTSFFGAVVGIVLLFWQRVVGATRRARQFFKKFSSARS
ncbi:MAG: hypothetical protein HYX76_05815 [Acidobacteria bacterium]|nr:hypothetical protein [Acidobacteriota bacterium]